MNKNFKIFILKTNVVPIFKTNVFSINNNFHAGLGFQLGLKIYFSTNNVKFINRKINENFVDNKVDFNKWSDFYIRIDSILVPSLHIQYSINKFYNEILSKFSKDTIFLIQFKIKVENDKIIRSISYVQTVMVKDYLSLNDIFKDFWDGKVIEYNYDFPKINFIIFSYKILSDEFKIENSQFNKFYTEIKESNSSKIKGWNLPATMDFTLWGYNYEISNDFTKAVVYKKDNAKYLINIFDDYINVKLQVHDMILFEFTDTRNDIYNLNTFTRKLKTHIYTYINGELVLRQFERKCNYLKSIKKNISISNKFLTMDLKTINIDGELLPVCISIYDGDQLFSFYLLDFENSDQLLKTALKSIMIKKYAGYIVYLHNFSYVDSVFLIKIISSMNIITKPIIRDNKIINLKIEYAKKQSLYFRDFYLLIPLSLDKSAKVFQVSNKSVFPLNFLKPENLNYIGNIPEFSEFKNITLEKYNEYILNFKNNKWNFKDELIKYCEQDVISLYEVIDKFSFLIFDLFNINVHRFPTISSLAFGIYRSNFYKDEFKIPLVYNQIYIDIKRSFTGGSVDVFKPYGKNVYHYDVVSLYPYIMKNFKMPVGKIIYFFGDILKFENKPYGIFKVEIKATENLKNPILQTKFNIKNGIRTISPLGSWTGWYHSEELFNAQKFGYKFNILEGYLFESKYIFNDYVDRLYKIKSEATKDNPLYIISNLLLNSFYGRFGMKPEIENHIIIDNKDSNEFHLNNKVSNTIDLKNGKELIRYSSKYYSDYNYLNISIPIPSTITALARVHMTNYKNNENYNILYTDTDSAFTDNPIDQNFIGDKLGQMKLENKFKKIVFLAPKLYGGINENNKQIIRISGLKDSIDYYKLEKLLNKENKLQKLQQKWNKKFSLGKITIKEELYTIMITDNKRVPVYEDNKYVDTKSIFIKNDEII